MLTAHQVRTSLVLGAAGATVIAALALHVRTATTSCALQSSELALSARLVSDKVVAGEQDLVATLDLDWRRVADGAPRTSQAFVATELTTDLALAQRTIDRPTLQEAEAAHSARVLEQATRAYETQGAAAAQAVIQRHMTEVQNNKLLDPSSITRISGAEGQAMEDFAKAPPAKAAKAARKAAYELAQ
jgi:hypothetical protein